MAPLKRKPMTLPRKARIRFARPKAHGRSLGPGYQWQPLIGVCLSLLVSTFLNAIPLLLLHMQYENEPHEHTPLMQVDFIVDDEETMPILVTEVKAGETQITPLETPKEIAAATAPKLEAAVKQEAPENPALASAQPKEQKALFKDPAVPAPANTPPEQAAAKLHEKDLDPLIAKPMVAFDESKTTKEVPKDAYLSDRTSTAADRGPKNLPRGDPFVDKGESDAIRYLKKRGEDNLPPLTADANAGSVKKEGSPDAGKGRDDPASPPDKKLPSEATLKVDEKLLAVLDQKDKTPLPEPVDRTASIGEALATTGPASKPLPVPSAEPERAAVADVIGFGGAAGVEFRPAPKVVKQEKPPVFVPPPVAPQAKNDLARIESKQVAEATQPARSKSEPVDELASFRALLDGSIKSEGRGGERGEKPGVHAREGAKGHEGNGSLRPGHSEAVSDVTSINLDSSASDFDEARFAKVFDPKTAYVKPLARRIDGKWKAERAARMRVRPVRGIVTMRVIIDRSGKLLEATEVERRPSGIPDEYAAMAKLAIERACSPLSEPFPPELSSRDSLEFVFSFLY